MRGFLLDTNVVSELIKRTPETKVVDWVRATDENLLYLSVLTIGEIRKGIALQPDVVRKVKLEAWLSGELVSRFRERILSINQNIADRWGQITASPGKPLPVIDGLLAATALEHNLTFVTRNVRDVAATSVRVFDPWNA